LKWCRLGGSDCPMDQGCYPPTPAVEYLGINYGSCM
jgi:hypothetical protein